jgi:hypothetical protein
MDDALRSVTRSAIKEARIKELKTEIINSEKLKVGADHLLFASLMFYRHILRTIRSILNIFVMTNHYIPPGFRLI